MGCLHASRHFRTRHSKRLALAVSVARCCRLRRHRREAVVVLSDQGSDLATLFPQLCRLALVSPFEGCSWTTTNSSLLNFTIGVSLLLDSCEVTGSHDLGESTVHRHLSVVEAGASGTARCRLGSRDLPDYVGHVEVAGGSSAFGAQSLVLVILLKCHDSVANSDRQF